MMQLIVLGSATPTGAQRAILREDGLAVPCLVERHAERRHPESCLELSAWVFAVNYAFAVFLSLAAMGVLENPMPVAGGKGAIVPVGFWALLMTASALMKGYGRLRRDYQIGQQGAKLGFLLWVAMSIAIYLPQQPVMSWVFAPMMALAEAVVHVRMWQAERNNRMCSVLPVCE
jgi:hypothetical protein